MRYGAPRELMLLSFGFLGGIMLKTFANNAMTSNVIFIAFVAISAWLLHRESAWLDREH